MTITNCKFHQITAEHIEREGRSIIGVSPRVEEDGFSFSYTIGNHLQGLPELLIIGSSYAPYLNDLSRLMIANGKAFEDGQVVQPLSVRLPLKIIHANNIARTEYAVQAGVYFGHDDYPIMQVLLTDKEGRFPGEEGCQPPYSLLPILRQQREYSS